MDGRRKQRRMSGGDMHAQGHKKYMDEELKPKPHCSGGAHRPGRLWRRAGAPPAACWLLPALDLVQ